MIIVSLAKQNRLVDSLDDLYGVDMLLGAGGMVRASVLFLLPSNIQPSLTSPRMLTNLL